MIYPIILGLHNLNRWLVLALGVWAFSRLFSGWRRSRAWSVLDQKCIHWFVVVLTLQFVLGVTLYTLPGALVNTVLHNVTMAVIMKQRVLRFFVLEHPVQMVLAIVCAYATMFFTRRSAPEQRRFAMGTLFLGITLLLILTAIPWPFLSQGRPLLRLP